MRTILHQVRRLNAHHRLYLAVGLAVAVLLILPDTFTWVSRLVVTWIAFAGVILALTWPVILQDRTRQMEQLSRVQDTGNTAIFFITIAASIMSLLAVIILMGSIKTLPQTEVSRHALLAMGAVVCSWWLVHTVFSLRYAHKFYSDEAGTDTLGGLEFPRQPKPDYMDFAYFSFVIGMTNQVSDVQVSSAVMRKLVFLHSVLSFGFNAVIVAVSINILAGVVQR